MMKLSLLLEFLGWVFLLGMGGIMLAAYTTGDIEKFRRRVKWKWAQRKKFIRIWFKYHYLSLRKHKWTHLWYLLSRKCSHCNTRGSKISLRHQNCAYVNEMSNYYHMCEDCHQEIHDMYQDWWDEYNAGRF